MAVPNVPGVYAFYLSSSEPLPFPEDPVTEITPGFRPLYVGQTGDSLRSRVGNHLYGDARTSTLRANLGLLSRDAFRLDLIRIAGKRYFAFRDEAPIDEWLAQKLVLGLQETHDPRRLEAEWLATSPGILNVAGRVSTALTKKIQLLRRAASGRCIAIPSR